MFEEWTLDPKHVDVPKIEPMKPDNLDLSEIGLPGEDLMRFMKYTGPPYYDIDKFPRSSNGMLVPPPGIPPSPF